MARSPPEQVAFDETNVDNTEYDPKRGAYFVRDLIDPRLYLAVMARGRRRFYVSLALGDWPELTVDQARGVVARIDDVIAAARLIQRPVRRDSEEVNMAAE